jgi:hypothetical protein
LKRLKTLFSFLSNEFLREKKIKEKNGKRTKGFGVIRR